MFKKLFGRNKPESEPKPAPAAPPPSKAKARPPAAVRQRRHPDDPAPIVEDITARGVNIDFRREGDEPHIFRVNQPTPKGFPKKLLNFIPVAGVSYRQAEVIDFIRGRDRTLLLRREILIEGEPPATAVYGRWDDWRGGQHEALLGYLPTEANAAVGDTPVEATLEAMYQATEDRTAGLRIDVWQPRPKKAK